jgi:sugar lactone lactonase YvrE
MKALTLAFLFICTAAIAQTYDTNGDYVQTFAGSGEVGMVNGQGQQTKFFSPSQIVADTSSNLYVWDSGNHLIREITPGGTVSTFVGGGLPPEIEGYGTNVSLNSYSFGQMTMDHSNTIWVVIGYGSSYYFLNIGTNGSVFVENGGLTNLTTSTGICFDSANNLYYSGANIIYRYNPNTGISQPFAGNGTSGYKDGNGTVFPEFAFGNATTGLACDQANNIYVWDSGNYRIRRIDQSQNITTIAGTGTGSSYPASDGVGTNATFGGNSPTISSMFSDNLGNIYFACGTCIRKMNAGTNVVTMAGSFTTSGSANGVTNIARFSSANGACLSQGMIFVADSGNELIRNIAFNPQPQIVTGANLGIGTFAGVTITGAVGRTYQIQSSPDLNTWTTRATLLLTSSPYLWIDQNPISGNNFYRALLLP